MRVEFDDEGLRRLAIDCEFAPGSQDAELIRAYRRRYQVLVAAKDVADLRALSCLDLRSADGRAELHASIRLLGGSRLLLDFHEDSVEEVTVVGIVEHATREVTP
jgi:proteic killer suppression protein